MRSTGSSLISPDNGSASSEQRDGRNVQGRNVEGRNVDGRNVEAVARFGRICALFTAQRPALTAREISTCINTPYKTTLKILATLERSGLLAKNDDGSFVLGLAWLRFANFSEEPVDIRRIARPVMRYLRDRINETVALAIRAGDKRINIDFVESTHKLRRVVRRNSDTPLHVGSGGRTLMAGMSDEDIAGYLARTPLIEYAYNTPTSAEAIWADIRAIRETGYFILTEEVSVGAASVSVPIKDYLGATLGVLTAGGPSTRFTQERRLECLPLMLTAASAFRFDLEPASRDA